MELLTNRLRLRPHRRADVEALLAYYADAKVSRFLLHESWTKAHAETEIDKRTERLGFSDGGTQLALVVEHDGQVIGDISLWLTDDTRVKAEIGWVFRPDGGGQGYATEAARAVLDWGFGSAGLHRIVAQMDARNTTSARLSERLAMTREAHLRQDWWSKGEWTDTVIYAILAEEHAIATGSRSMPSSRPD